MNNGAKQYSPIAWHHHCRVAIKVALNTPIHLLKIAELNNQITCTNWFLHDTKVGEPKENSCNKRLLVIVSGNVREDR